MDIEESAALNDMGYKVNKKRVLRLMRLMELVALCPSPNLSLFPKLIKMN